MAISVVGQYPKFRAWDPATKLPLVGGKLYCYAPGTTTNKAIYTTYARTVQAANPVILDANGEGLFYLDGIYDLALFDSNDVAVWTVADYNDQPTSASASVTAPAVEGSPTNPSFEFEGETAGLPANWTIFKWNTVVLDTVVSFSGTKSLKFTSPGGAPGTSGGGTATSDKFITSPASTISLGVTLKSSAAGVHNQVEILEYNSADALQATTTIYDDATTNPAAFTTFWRTITLGANTAWAKVYIVGAKNDSPVAGTTWVDGIEIRQATAGGTINLNHLTFAASLVVTSAGLTITAEDFIVDSADSNVQTSVAGILSTSTTLDVLAGTALVLQGNTIAINGLASTTVTTPALVVNATTSAAVTTPVLTITASTSAGITTPALTLTSSTSITIVTPLITSVLGLVVGAATGGAKGNGTINAVGLYDDNKLVLANGTNNLAETLTINTFGVVLQAPTGGSQGSGTLNAQGLFVHGKAAIHAGGNALTESLTFTGNQEIIFDNKVTAYSNRAVAVAIASSVASQSIGHGRVTGTTGALASGQGFTPVRNAVGSYTLTWATAFSTTPAASVSALTSGRRATITAISTTTCSYETVNIGSGLAEDIDAAIVVVGNR